jgi:hypothetical protein
MRTFPARLARLASANPACLPNKFQIPYALATCRTVRVARARLLKKLMVVLGMLAMGFAGGGLLGFSFGYVIAGEGRNNIHGDAILVGLLTIGGAIAGLIVGAVTSYRVVQRGTRPA